VPENRIVHRLYTTNNLVHCRGNQVTMNAIEQAIDAIEQAIIDLKKQQALLESLLPPPAPRKRERVYWVHPVTGEKRYVKMKRGKKKPCPTRS